jgi:hypothetical protein
MTGVDEVSMGGKHPLASERLRNRESLIKLFNSPSHWRERVLFLNIKSESMELFDRFMDLKGMDVEVLDALMTEPWHFRGLEGSGDVGVAIGLLMRATENSRTIFKRLMEAGFPLPEDVFLEQDDSNFWMRDPEPFLLNMASRGMDVPENLLANDHENWESLLPVWRLSPVHVAVRYKNWDILPYLQEKGFSMEVPDPETGLTAGIAAFLADRVDIAVQINIERSIAPRDASELASDMEFVL